MSAGSKSAAGSEFKQFTVSEARPLPVILLADVSGSMAEEGKIDSLNRAVREMVETFSTTEDLRAEVHVAVIVFGGDARLHVPLQAASRVKWIDMKAHGGTPMGAAFEMAAALIEDRDAVPSRAYRPSIILVSDGMPTDDWERASIPGDQGRPSSEGRSNGPGDRRRRRCGNVESISGRSWKESLPGRRCPTDQGLLPACNDVHHCPFSERKSQRRPTDSRSV